MDSNFKIISNQNLIVETLSNNINTKDYSKLKHDEFHHKSFNRNFNLVTDWRSYKGLNDKTDLHNLITIFKENKGKINRQKSALVVSDSNFLKDIILTHTKSKKQICEIKIFTNIEDAKNWVSD